MDWIVLEEVGDDGARLVARRLSDGARRILYANEHDLPLHPSVHPRGLRVAVDAVSRSTLRGQIRLRVGLINLEQPGLGWLRHSLDPKWRLSRAVFDDSGKRLAVEAAYDGAPLSDIYIYEIALSGNSARERVVAGAGNRRRLGCARPTFLPGGERLLYFENTRPDGAWELNLFDLERSGDSAFSLQGRAPSALALPLTEGAAAVPDLGVCWCPALERAFFVSEVRGGTRQRMAWVGLAGGEHHGLGQSHLRFEEITVAPGGELVAYSADGTLWLADVESGATAALVEGHAGTSHRGLRFDLEGGRLLFCTNDAKGATVRAVNLADQSLDELAHLGPVSVLGLYTVPGDAATAARLTALPEHPGELREGDAPDADAHATIVTGRPTQREPVAELQPDSRGTGENWDAMVGDRTMVSPHPAPSLLDGEDSDPEATPAQAQAPAPAPAQVSDAPTAAAPTATAPNPDAPQPKQPSAPPEAKQPSAPPEARQPSAPPQPETAAAPQEAKAPTPEPAPDASGQEDDAAFDPLADIVPDGPEAPHGAQAPEAPEAPPAKSPESTRPTDSATDSATADASAPPSAPTTPDESESPEPPASNSEAEPPSPAQPAPAAEPAPPRTSPTGAADPRHDFVGWMKQLPTRPDPAGQLRVLIPLAGEPTVRDAARVYLSIQARRAEADPEAAVPLIFAIGAAAYLKLNEARPTLEGLCRRALERLETTGRLPDAEEHFAIAALRYLDGRSPVFDPIEEYAQFESMLSQANEARRLGGDAGLAAVLEVFVRMYRADLEAALNQKQAPAEPDEWTRLKAEAEAQVARFARESAGPQPVAPASGVEEEEWAKLRAAALARDERAQRLGAPFGRNAPPAPPVPPAPRAPAAFEPLRMTPAPTPSAAPLPPSFDPLGTPTARAPALEEVKSPFSSTFLPPEGSPAGIHNGEPAGADWTDESADLSPAPGADWRTGSVADRLAARGNAVPDPWEDDLPPPPIVPPAPGWLPIIGTLGAIGGATIALLGIQLGAPFVLFGALWVIAGIGLLADRRWGWMASIATFALNGIQLLVLAANAPEWVPSAIPALAGIAALACAGTLLTPPITGRYKKPRAH